MTAVVCLLALAAAAPIPKTPPPTTPAELLVGTWELVASEPAPPSGLAATLAFTAAGELTISVSENGKPTDKSRTGKYKLDGDRLEVEFNTVAGPKADNTMTLKSVTADKLVLLEGKTKTHELKRIKPAK